MSLNFSYRPAVRLIGREYPETSSARACETEAEANFECRMMKAKWPPSQLRTHETVILLEPKGG